MHKCPKHEQRAWAPGDFIEVECPGCGQTMEFFKDKQSRKCRKCGQEVINTKQQKA
jgi:ribosomal protein S27E